MLPLVLKLHSSVSDAACIELYPITADELMNVPFLKTSKLLLTIYLPINIQHKPLRIFLSSNASVLSYLLVSVLFILLFVCVWMSLWQIHQNCESFISLIRDAFIPFEGLQTPQQIEGFPQTDG